MAIGHSYTALELSFLNIIPRLIGLTLVLPGAPYFLKQLRACDVKCFTCTVRFFYSKMMMAIIAQLKMAINMARIVVISRFKINVRHLQKEIN